jgi:D-alanyl-D-alanine dipeptidase
MLADVRFLIAVSAGAAVAAATAITACSEPSPTSGQGPNPISGAPAKPDPVAVVDASTPDAAIPDAPVAAPQAGRHDWVDVSTLIPDAVIDMRYATADNFTKTVLYPVARCLLRRSVADRLVRAAETLRAESRRLLLWDCYRPASLQKILWDLIKDPRYVAKPVFDASGVPVSGSRHSRGAAIDVGLVDAAGDPVPLPTAHDDFTRAAHRSRAKKSYGKAELARLDAALGAAGFIGMPTEWWHYDAEDALEFPLADTPLDAP